MPNEVNDLNSRFNNVHIAKKEADGTLTPKYVETFYVDDNGNTKVRFMDRETGHHNDVIWSEDDYELDCPRVGMVFDGEKVAFLKRTPERQWKRGYTTNVVRTNHLNQREAREMGLESVDQSSVKIIKYVYNPTYIPMEAGMRGLSTGKLFSFPLSNKFAVVLKGDYKYPVVFYKEWIVGWVEDGTVVLTAKTKHLIEELSQYATCREA